MAVARALATEPEVLLMDEPLSNLDALLRMEMRAELKTVLAESKTTTIYVTHDQVEAMSMADRIAIMNKGEIVQAASAVEVYRNPAAHFVGSFIGNPPMNFLDAKPAGRWFLGRRRRARCGPLPVISKNCASAFVRRILSYIRLARRQRRRINMPVFSATVRILEPLGSHLLASCKIDDQMLRVVLDSDATIKAGDELRWSPVTGRVRWFDPATELAIAAA